jgi:hypothetical protein
VEDPKIKAELAKDDCDINIVLTEFLLLIKGIHYKSVCANELENLKYDGENIRMFKLKFQSLTVNSGGTYDKATSLTSFIAKLPEQWQATLTINPDITTVSKAVNWLLVYGSNTRVVNSTALVRDKVLEDRVRELEEALKQVSINAASYQPASNESSSYQNRGRGNRGRGAQSRGRGHTHSQTKDQKANSCASCGMSGHKRDDCVVWLQRIPCAKCGNLGHTEKVCFSKK